MTLCRRAMCVFVMAVFAMCACVFVSGCGKQPAATWAHGDVSEEEVTNVANNMRSYYQIKDDDSWALFVQSRAYDTSDELANASGNTVIKDAQSKGSGVEYSSSDLGANIESNGSDTANADGSNSTDAQKTEEAAANDGTVEEMREYIIEQVIRQAIIDREIKERNITVSEKEIDEYVEQQREYVESQLMKGVFESYLQSQGYANLKAYREDVRVQYLQLKLAQEVAGKEAADGSISVDSQAWLDWLNDMYAKAEVKINPAPAELSYAIKTSSESTSESSSSSSDSR